MRSGLDALYRASGALAALFIVLICLVVAVQVFFNLVTKVFGTQFSYTLPSYADFAGFFLAAASFLALASTLKAGSHIRVTLLISRLGPMPRVVVEVFSALIGAALSGFSTWYMARLNLDSLRFGDLSYGIIAIPIWVPQLGVTLGLGVLTVAFADIAISTLLRRAPVLVDQEGIE